MLARASIAQPLASWDDGSAKQAIIAVLGEGPITGKTDGMVAYESAHIEGVESENAYSDPNRHLFRWQIDTRSD